MDLEQLLLDRFGFPGFRAGQREIIEHVVEGRDALVVMPTGAGKSLTYQLPATMLEGTCVVISPLIALMHDQLRSASANGIRAATLTSADENRAETVARLRAGDLDMLERLAATDAASVKGDAGLVYAEAVSLGYQGITVNVDNGERGDNPFGNEAKLRQAFSLSLDRDAINQVVFEGAFAPGNASLNRFFSLHYLLPFMIAGVVILHIWALHVTGQTNPTGVEVKSKTDTLPFTPYATMKDALGVSLFLIVFAWFIFYMPNYLGHPDNYIEANPLSTPAHPHGPTPAGTARWRS